MACWLLGGGGRRFVGFAILLAGTVLTAIGVAGYFASDDLDSAPFAFIAAMGAAMCYLGYWIHRRRPAAPLLGRLVATIAEPIPSNREISPEDVLGTWQFYVDDAMRTVTIDLRADHRYEQMLVSNQGERVDAPGGTWKLDGPYLELSSYRSAAREATQCIRWFFGDLGKEWVLFATDTPRGESTLLGLRREAGAVS